MSILTTEDMVGLREVLMQIKIARIVRNEPTDFVLQYHIDNLESKIELAQAAELTFDFVLDDDDDCAGGACKI